MFRQIITPSETQYTINFPPEFIGKEVELIAFTVKESEQIYDKEQVIKDAIAFWDKNRVDLSNFKFNREEANER